MDGHVKRADLVLISYRREDSAGVTGRIYDRLVQKFGREAIFKDVNSIPLGVNFRQYIDSVVGQCGVVLVVIGDRWMGATGEAGKCRLDDPRDFVRVEIESALQRNIPVIPLLVQNASMPSEERLPPTLTELAYRNGMTVGHDPHFHGDIDRLIKHLANFFADLPNPEDPTSRQNAVRGLYAGVLNSTEEEAQTTAHGSDFHEAGQTDLIEPKLSPLSLRPRVLGSRGLIIGGSILMTILALALSLSGWWQGTTVNNGAITARVKADQLDRISNTTGSNLYRFSIWLDIPEGERGSIREVEYHFNHSSFGADKIKTSRDSTHGFLTGYEGWGPIKSVDIKVIYKNGRTEAMNLNMIRALGWRKVSAEQHDGADQMLASLAV